jgi:hypothetical protein
MTLSTFRLCGVFILLFVGCGAFLGCGEEQRREESPERRSGIEVPDRGPPSWLGARDGIEPAEWLIEREKASGSHLSESDVRNVRVYLSKASARFKESSRMIANHAAQLEVMLKPEGQNETAIVLITRLTDMVGEADHPQGFGAIGQQYYNLRKAGFSVQQALDDLSKRYGSSN